MFFHHIPLGSVGIDGGFLIVGLHPLAAQVYIFIAMPQISHVFSNDECEKG